jgi:hypothetical protein
VSVPRWGSAPAYRFALAVERAATPAALVDRIERFVRLAAPYLAAGAGERRSEETRTRLEQARREISEARRSAREAVVDALLGRIAGRVCAELADPLGSVLGCARSLSETTEDRARATLVDDLLEASARGCRIVEHLAAVCALEPSGDWGPFPPRPVLLEAAEECDRELRETGARVAIRVETDLPPVEGSRALLRFSIGHALRALARRPDGSPRSLSFEAGPTPGGILVRASVVGEEHAAPNSGPGMESERLSWSIAEEVWKEFGAQAERDGGSFRLLLATVAQSGAAGS